MFDDPDLIRAANLGAFLRDHQRLGVRRVTRANVLCRELSTV